jgi:hypothetical protein
MGFLAPVTAESWFPYFYIGVILVKPKVIALIGLAALLDSLHHEVKKTGQAFQ